MVENKKLKLINQKISLDESAIIDGANYFQIFFKIILPLLSPAIITVLITKGVGIYNDFYTTNNVYVTACIG